MKQLDGQYECTLCITYGVIRLYRLEELEVFLLETSYHFGSTEKIKSSFDHHKGPFGVLSMLKTIVDNFNLGSVEVFAKLKVLFVHASGNTIYLWSMRHVEDGPAYELWLKKRLDLDRKFENKTEKLVKAINFYWKMKCLLEESVDVVHNFKKEYQEALKKYRFMSFPSENLSSPVNPSIMKLNKAEDKTDMGELGPFYT